MVLRLLVVGAVIPSGPLHPELALAGVGVAAVVLLLTWRRPDRALALASVAATGALVVALDASWWLIVATAVAAVGERLPIGVWIGSVAVTAAAASAATAAAGPGRVVLIVAVPLLALAGRQLPGVAHPAMPVALAGGALAALWAGGPDTEATLLAASVLLPVALVAARSSAPAGHDRAPVAARQRDRAQGWAPVLVLVAWVAVEAYRGRPTGLGAAAIALAGPVALALAVRSPAGRLSAGRGSASEVPPSARPRLAPVLQGVAVTAWVTAAVVAARTIGNDRSYEPGWWVATATVAVVLASGWVGPALARPGQPPGPGRPAAASRRS